MRQDIELIRENFKESYRVTTQRNLEEAVKKESRLVKQYRGREVFELLQNIDDAGEGCDRCVASFVMDDDWLTVSNNGTPFTLDTLQRLCQGSVSNKSKKYIGCKGIGFRAVRNWADIVEIHSGSGDEAIAVRFSEDSARQDFDGLSADPHVSRQIDELRRQGYDPEIPIFHVPQPIELIDKKYDTEIRLRIKDDVTRGSIERDLREFDRSALLFLPNIKEIRIKIGDTPETVVSKVQSDVDTVAIDDGATRVAYRLSVKETRIDRALDGSDILKMAVAIPLHESYPAAGGYKLYTFFPILDLESPFPALLHATFNLTDNRNDLDIASRESRDINSLIWDELLRFYVDSVERFESADTLRRLKLLYPRNFSPLHAFGGSLGKLGKENVFFEYCRSGKIFCNVNGKYLSADQGLYVLPDVPPCFRSNAFHSVIRIADDDGLLAFARYIAENDNGQVEVHLKDVVDKVSARWSADNRVKVFKWWCDNGFTSLPKLLRTTMGEFITDSDRPCFLRGKITDIPSWAEISTLADRDDRRLVAVFRKEIDEERRKGASADRQGKKQEADRRILPRLISKKLINIQEQSSREVMISPVNSAVDNYDHAVDFVKWLWKIWQDNKFEESVRQIKFNLPAGDGTVVRSEKLFFGSGFDNDTGVAIFRSLGGYKELAAVTLEGSPSVDERIRFFEALGVSRFPRLIMLEKKELYHAVANEVFWKYANLNRCDVHDPVKYYSIKVRSISGIESVLENIDTSLLLKWIFSGNGELRDGLGADAREPSESFLEYRPYIQGQRSNRLLLDGNRLPSFLRYMFSTSPWLDVDGKRVAPCDVMISNDLFLHELGVSCITEKDIVNMAGTAGCGPGLLTDLLVALGAVQSFTDLDSERFYGILLEISCLDDPSQIERSKKLSREIYRQIIENGRRDVKKFGFCQDSDSKRDFFKSGKVLARGKNGDSSYHNVNEVYFSSSAVLNLGNRYLIDVPRRSGQKDDFENILNIKPFDQEYTVLSFFESCCQSRFASELRHYLPCLAACRKDSGDIIGRLKIVLVRSAIIEVDKTEITPSVYLPLKRSGHEWLITVGDAPDLDSLDKGRIADCITRILNVFLSFPSQDFLRNAFQLYLLSQSQREECVMYDCGSKEDIERAKREIYRLDTLRAKIVSRLENDFPDKELGDIVDDIDWLDMESVSAQRQIAKLLETVGRDVDYLSDVIELPVSLSAYNHERIRIERAKRIDYYKNAVYSFLCHDIDKRKSLKSIWDSLSNDEISVDGNINHVGFDVKECVERFMKGALIKVGITGDYSMSYIDYKEVYDRNIDKLQAIDFASDFINEFCNDPKNDSLLYFGDEDVVMSFREYVDARKNDSTDGNHDSSVDMKKLIGNAVVTDEFTPGRRKVPNRGGKRGTTVSSNRAVSHGRNAVRQGDAAEYLTIVKLSKKEIFQAVEFLGEDYSIKWVSGASKRVERLKDMTVCYDCTESDDSIGYDIELISADKMKRLYIEVKSSSADDCSFIMSEREYRRAKELDSDESRYRVVFVASINLNDVNTRPKITYIDSPVYDERVFKASPVDYSVTYNP